MKPSTREWIKKAESDYQAALTLARRRKISFHDQACFHYQQSAEKYLKARLEEANIRSPKTHDLDKLLSLLLPVEPLWEALLPALLRLNDYAVEIRYPGHAATARDVKAARQDARTVRRDARLSLGVRA
jgi:HEPN domain-containing protein